MKKFLCLLLMSVLLLSSTYALADMQYFFQRMYPSAESEYGFEYIRYDLLYDALDLEVSLAEQKGSFDWDAISAGHPLIMIGFEQDENGKYLKTGKCVYGTIGGDIFDSTYQTFSYVDNEPQGCIEYIILYKLTDGSVGQLWVQEYPAFQVLEFFDEENARYAQEAGMINEEILPGKAKSWAEKYAQQAEK